MGHAHSCDQSWCISTAKLIDGKDANSFGALFAEKGTFKFGNQASVVGPTAIAAYCEYFFNMICSSKHTFVSLTSERGAGIEARLRIAWEGKCEYTRLNSSKVTNPFTNIVHFNRAGLITRYNIYIDNSNLFEPSTVSGGMTTPARSSGEVSRSTPTNLTPQLTHSTQWRAGLQCRYLKNCTLCF